jgi:hypothetical protein
VQPPHLIPKPDEIDPFTGQMKLPDPRLIGPAAPIGMPACVAWSRAVI